jgi:hypothetical protein
MEENPYQSPRTPAAEPCHIGEPIRVSGRLTWDDHWAIGTLYGSGGKWQPRLQAAGMVLFMIGSLTVLALYWYRALETQSAWQVLTSISVRAWLIGLAAVALPGLYYGLGWWLRRVGRAASDRAEGIYALQHYVFTEEGVDVRSQNIESRVKWDAFSSLRRNDEYLVLHLKPEGSGWIGVARKWFGDPRQWDTLIRYAAQRVTQTG